MKKLSRILFRVLKICGITIAAILILLFTAPYFFPKTVSGKIKDWTNQSIRGQIEFSKARLSFFTHFPSLTLTLYDVNLKGAPPFQQDTLITASKLGFGINLQKLFFDHLVSINKIFLTKANIYVLVNEKGQANYDIYVSDTNSHKPQTDTSAASLHLEKIVIKDSRLFYQDQSVPMLIQAEHLYYEGTGDLSQSIFDLDSHLRTDSLNFVLDNLSYVSRKAFEANLITKINTKNLSLIFGNNRFTLNKLSFVFTGKLDFLKNGYDMDFNISTKDADLYKLITIFPPSYLEWLNQTKVSGTVNLNSSLKGKYIVSENQMPDFKINLLLKDGFIAYQDTKVPLTGINLDAMVELPGLDMEKLHLRLDSLRFHLDKDFLRANGESRGYHEPQVNFLADANLDLHNLQQSMGLKNIDMRGQLDLHARVDGKYSKKVVAISLRKKDTVIATIPAFDVKANLKNGLIRFYANTKPIQNIFLHADANCPDANYRHAYFKIDSLHAESMKNFIEGRAIVHASTDFPLDLNLKGSVDLSDVKEIYPLDSLTLAGKITFAIKSNGKYAPDHHLFPKTNAHFSMTDGLVQTKYYPHPIQKIHFELEVNDDQGDLKGLNLSVQPLGIEFEGKPFLFHGKFKNFDDLNYDLMADGQLDLGKIYRVFARKDMSLDGFLKIDAAFKGIQSDAMNGRYDAIHGSGTMELNNLTLSSELFPKPFILRRGNFRFDQEKMWFENFQANYGTTDLKLDGFAENVINYCLGQKAPLKASFDLHSKNFDLDEFAFYAESKNSSPNSPISHSPNSPISHSPISQSPNSPISQSPISTGVILIPQDLDLNIKATADLIKHSDIRINHFQGGVNIKDGAVQLTETSFELINCQVMMNGKYSSTSPLRADFDYHLQAKDFDVHRAYQEIKLFHDLAQSAEYANGIISIDYTLNGKLNEQMMPIYPSLKGGGVLSVKQVKFKGWKLFNTVSSASGKSELTDPDLSKIDVKSTIKNNLITIERVKFKTGGFRIRMEGQTSFDSKVNFKMRIGLPPLGIIGIPIRITGDANNPKIKLGNKDSDPLEEKEE